MVTNAVATEEPGNKFLAKKRAKDLKDFKPS